MYKVTSDYRILVNQMVANGSQYVVKMWYFNGIPFTFDDVDEPSLDLIQECMNEEKFTMEDLYQTSNYLILEQCHPLLFEMEEKIECEEELPF